MRRTSFVVTALLLALALAAPGVALADEPDAAVPAAELLPLEEANQTPAEIEELETFDLEKELRVSSFRACEPHEAALCPSGCACAVVFNVVRCFC